MALGLAPAHQEELILMVLYFFTCLAVPSFTGTTTSTFSQNEEEIKNHSEGNQPQTNHLHLSQVYPSFPSPTRPCLLHNPSLANPSVPQSPLALCIARPSPTTTHHPKPSPWSPLLPDQNPRLLLPQRPGSDPPSLKPLSSLEALQPHVYR